MMHRTVEVRARCYRSSDIEIRHLLTLEWRNVRTLTTSLDASQLADNSRAGNINYWTPGNLTDPSFIYLADGFIRIEGAAPVLSWKIEE